MRKNYIIKDARRILAEQIRDNGMNTMNKNPITNATGLSAIIPKDNDGYCTVYKMDCEDGLGLMTVYQVYPGIQLIYNDFEATSCYWDGTIDKNVLEIASQVGYENQSKFATAFRDVMKIAPAEYRKQNSGD